MDTLTHKCTVYSRWMWSIEQACITITSPSGGTVLIKKFNLDKLTDVELRLVWDCVEAATVSSEGAINLTKEEMQMLVSAAKKTNGTVYQPHKKKEKSFAQRKFESAKRSRRSILDGVCSCGGTLTLRDHGKWVGYYCPKCKAGGSRTKNYKRY